MTTPTTAELRDAVQPDTHQADRGPCCLVRSGNWFYPEDPRPEEILIADVAHALSLQCRYNGHCPEFYSVAQHAAICSSVAETLGYDRATQLEALLHDAAEAYCSDLPRPLKLVLPGYYALEDRVQTAIAAKYGFEHPMSPEVKEIDNRVLHTEARDLGINFNMTWGNEDEGPYEFAAVNPVGPEEAKYLFLGRFCELTGHDLRSCLAHEV